MKETGRYLMILVYVVAGFNHFVHPLFYRDIIPEWLPDHALLVNISGICEVLSALLLLYPATRKAGAWLIILLLIAVFPANIQMAMNAMKGGSPLLWAAMLRLPVQLLLIGWAWTYTKSKNREVGR